MGIIICQIIFPSAFECHFVWHIKILWWWISGEEHTRLWHYIHSYKVLLWNMFCVHNPWLRVESFHDFVFMKILCTYRDSVRRVVYMCAYVKYRLWHDGYYCWQVEREYISKQCTYRLYTHLPQISLIT